MRVGVKSVQFREIGSRQDAVAGCCECSVHQSDPINGVTVLYQLSNCQLFTYILCVRASYMAIRIHVQGLYCSKVLHLRKPACFLFALVQGYRLCESEHEAGDGDSGFCYKVWPRYQTACRRHLNIREMSGQRVRMMRYFHNYFTLLRLTESFPFVVFISQKIALFLLAY